MSAEITAADFSGLTGQVFPIEAVFGGEGVDVPLTLTAVKEFPAPGPGFRAQFSLSLSGPPEPVLAQGVYELVHPEHGAMPLLVVPHAASADGAEYSISFG